MGKRTLVKKAAVDTEKWRAFLHRLLVRKLGEPRHSAPIERGVHDSEWRRGECSLGATIEYRDLGYAFGVRDPLQLNLLLSDWGVSLDLKVTKRGCWLEWDEGDLKELPRHRGDPGRRLFCLIARLDKSGRRSAWGLTESQARRIARLFIQVFQA